MSEAIMRNIEKDKWFGETVRVYEPRLLRFLGKMVPLSIAREIVQETFIKLLKEDFGVIRNHTAEWLFTVCRNSVRDHVRREGLVPVSSTSALTVVDQSPLPLDAIETRQQLELVRASIHRLPSIEQEVIRLKFQEGFSYKEINRITGHSVSYIGVLIYQAVQKIRGELSMLKGDKNETGT
jgi:RNA polymerase sigma factor (sigma-70 family)